MLREWKGMGNLRLVIPGIPGNPGNHIKKTRLNSRFDLFSCLDQPSAKLKINMVFPGQNFLFPGTGREITKCHGKGREIWGLYSWESPETGIPAHSCSALCVEHSIGDRRLWEISCNSDAMTRNHKNSLASVCDHSNVESPYIYTGICLTVN